jgi:hypothetical protein
VVSAKDSYHQVADIEQTLSMKETPEDIFPRNILLTAL